MLGDLAGTVREAAGSLTGFCRRTPLIPARIGEATVRLKLENLQHTGSFKYRGALTALQRAQADGRVSSCGTYSAERTPWVNEHHGRERALRA